MKPIAKQLIVAVFILALVTVASLGIRQIRFGADRAKTVESSVVVETEPAPGPAESDTVDAEPELQHADMPEPAEEVPSEEHAKAKAKDSGGLQKISMGGDDNVYITEEGQTWYVTEGSKARVEIDDSTGEITVLQQYGDDGK